MAGDTVTTVFGGDDSPFQAVARRVLQTIRGIAGFRPPGNAFAAIHTGFRGIETASKGAIVGVTALKGAFLELLPVVGAIAGVTSVVAAFGKAISQASERETAVQRLRAVTDAGEDLAGGMERLEKASHQTGRDFPELAKSVQSFKEASLPLDEAVTATEKLNEISLVTGKDLGELTEVFTRISVKGEASFKDLAKFIAVPGVGRLAKEFKSLETETKSLEFTTSRQIELWRRQFEQVQRNTAAIDSFAQETGIAKETFDAWKQSGFTGGPIQQIGGIGGIGGVSAQMIDQFKTGIAQISKETGLSEDKIKEFI